ncbi:MaoC/PaaZ C-terminal domain-containing protein [Actinoalloteichus hymeniacidonis]|uniref:Acyl dehydratase n=1 Tax=Actinoalloteichus hymeniacidonis TaxID=340345 RepID=A0AAC9MZN6_9PSEU|nr:MaoC/PaaZ C-terminal domain-containing protein [Actinoalloteichus hymeniacidonis]AOS65608.1 acyl dehydratase [Actinoalloteichus hymeniacidonis]MBB5906302.1 acyl dehydratase [Actinoalloteichus hymeniacidonis]
MTGAALPTQHVDLRAVAPGTALPTRRFAVTRGDLVRYAGAAGDFNPIHFSDHAAEAKGLPGVIAHGALTMALAARAVGEWAGGGSRIVEYGVRFAKPVPVPDDGRGAEITVDALVGERLTDHRVRIDLTVRCGRDKVLTRARLVLESAAEQ